MRDDETSQASITLAPAIRIAHATIRTPIGKIQVAASTDRVLFLELENQRSLAPPFKYWLGGHILQKKRTAALDQVLAELRDYFAGTRRRFRIAVAPSGTEFQQRVWQMVAEIPYGETRTYGRLALQLGNFKLARAVGAAIGANPIPIIIPCHRVIAGDGSLAGFAGGLSRKVWLLRHEGVLLA